MINILVTKFHWYFLYFSCALISLYIERASINIDKPMCTPCLDGVVLKLTWSCSHLNMKLCSCQHAATATAGSVPACHSSPHARHTDPFKTNYSGINIKLPPPESCLWFISPDTLNWIRGRVAPASCCGGTHWNLSWLRDSLRRRFRLAELQRRLSIWEEFDKDQLYYVLEIVPVIYLSILYRTNPLKVTHW